MNLPIALVAEARSVSAYVTEVVVPGRLRERSLVALSALSALYGGPPPSDELARARRTLRPVPNAVAV